VARHTSQPHRVTPVLISTDGPLSLLLAETTDGTPPEPVDVAEVQVDLRDLTQCLPPSQVQMQRAILGAGPRSAARRGPTAGHAHAVLALPSVLAAAQGSRRTTVCCCTSFCTTKTTSSTRCCRPRRSSRRSHVVQLSTTTLCACTATCLPAVCINRRATISQLPNVTRHGASLHHTPALVSRW